MNACEKTLKRKNWPVDLGNGDSVKIRAMTKREKLELNGIKASEQLTESDAADKRAYYILGTIRLHDDSTPMFTRNPEESAIDFATRVDAEMLDVPEDNKMLILHAWGKVESVPPLEKLAKN